MTLQQEYLNNKVNNTIENFNNLTEKINTVNNLIENIADDEDTSFSVYRQIQKFEKSFKKISDITDLRNALVNLEKELKNITF